MMRLPRVSLNLQVSFVCRRIFQGVELFFYTGSQGNDPSQLDAA
jgi:hypothetical protein